MSKKNSFNNIINHFFNVKMVYLILLIIIIIVIINYINAYNITNLNFNRISHL